MDLSESVVTFIIYIYCYFIYTIDISRKGMGVLTNIYNKKEESLKDCSISYPYILS